MRNRKLRSRMVNDFGALRCKAIAWRRNFSPAMQGRSPTPNDQYSVTDDSELELCSVELSSHDFRKRSGDLFVGCKPTLQLSITNNI